jgi:predicted NBD/HSP70 family sugar kinase
VENVISGPALERFYFEQTGKSLSLKNILANTTADAAAAATLKRLISFFGKAIAVVINILDPDVIVLGGGVGNTPELYTLGVAEARKYLFNNRIDTLLLRPSLGDSAGVFGAAMLWK